MADSRPRLLFYVLHLLGVGHVYRAKRLVEAFHAKGMEVDIVFGGMPLNGISFASENIYYLPPIRAGDATYKRTFDADGNELSDEYKAKRKAVLLDVFSHLKPDAILIEAFPFGRRVIRDEMDALLEAASRRDAPPLIISSVRDILQEKRKPGRSEEARDWIKSRFDHVLVHSDPNVIRLDETFPLAREIKDKLAYTGFVIPPPEQANDIKTYDVIVSAGGGGFGDQLMQAALPIANADPGRRWCLSTGPNLDAETVSSLHNASAPNVRIVQRLDHLAEHMKHARVSISQCGYNTAMDVLAAHEASRCRAVFVPHDITGQTEQLRRAQLLEQAGYAICLPQSQLTQEGLKTSIAEAGKLPRAEHIINFDGAANSAKLLLNWMRMRS